jgi:TolA-binding protein
MMIRLFLFSAFLLASASAQVSNSDTDFLYARKLFDDKLYPLAAQEFSRFIRNYPSDARVPDARYYSGMSYYHGQMYDNARREFQFLAIDFPKDKRAADAWQKVAECYAALGDYAAAANALSSVATFYPDAPNAVSSVLLASDYFLKAGDTRSAKDKLQKLIADRPSIPEVHQARLKLAQLFLREDNTTQALAELLGVIEKGKDPELVSQAVFERAKLMESLGKSDDARAGYERIIARFTKTSILPAAMFEMGLISIREKNFDDARTAFEAVVRRPDASATLKQRAQVEIGDTYFAQGQYNKAGESYRSAGNAAADSTVMIESRFKVALTLEKVNNLKVANEELIRIADLGVTAGPAARYTALAYLKLAQNFQQLKQFREAAAYYDHFIRKFPNHPKIDRAHFQRGTLLLNELKDYQEAILALQELTEKHRNSILKDQAELLLARAYRMNGQLAEAASMLRQFRPGFPGSEWIDEAESELEYIRLFYPESSTRTLENMIYLIGSLIEDRSKDEVTFAYGQLFFDQIKDYQKAVGIFHRVAGLTQNRAIREEAWLYAAQCYDRLAQQYPEQRTWADSALNQYRLLTGGKYADVAAMRIIETTLSGIDDSRERAIKAKSYFEGLLERYPSSGQRDRMLIRLGQAMQTLKEFQNPAAKKKSEDSVKVKFNGAISCYDELILRYPTSPFTDEAYFQKAVCYSELGAGPELVKALQQYLGGFPRGRHVARAKYMLARYNEEQGDFRSAITAYNELINEYYYTGYADSAAQGIGNNYLLTQQYALAIDAYQNSLKLHLGDFSDVDVLSIQTSTHNPVDYKIAFAYDRLGNLSRAIEFYENYLFPDRKGAHAPEALSALATIYEKKNDRPNALRYYGYLNDLYPTHDLAFKGLIRTAEIYFESEKYQEARAAYEALSKKTKDTGQQLIFDSRAVVCAYRLGLVQQTSALEQSFDKKYEKNKDLKTLYVNATGEFLFELGRYYQYQKLKYDLAFKTYSKIIDDYKNNGIAADALFEMAVIRFKEGKSKEGFELLQQIPQKYPSSEIIPRVYLRFAIEAFQLEQAQTAIDAAKTALQHPNITRVDARVGTDFLIKVYKAAGYYENALLLIQDYLEKFSDSDAADLLSKRIDIGVMHKNLKAYDRSIEYFKELIKVAAGEDEAEIQFHIGETYFAMGNFEQALLEYLRIPYLTLGTKFDWATAAKSQAAECYARLNKLPEAVQMYEEIIRKHGMNSEYGRFARQRIEDLKKLAKSP